MLIKHFEPGGRMRRVKRRMIFGCKVCGARLECPKDEEQWGWLKSDDAQGFLAEHYKCGILTRRSDETTAGWHFEFDEENDAEESTAEARVEPW